MNITAVIYCQTSVHKKCSRIKGSTYKVIKPFIRRGCSNPVISTGYTSVDIGASVNLEIVDKFWMEMLMQLWKPKSELDGINSSNWYHYLPIGIYH